MWVIHHRQGLAFGVETCHDFARVHSGLDELQSDIAANRLPLFSHVDDAAAAFADFLQQLVTTDPSANQGFIRPRTGGYDLLLGQEGMITGSRKVSTIGLTPPLTSLPSIGKASLPSGQCPNPLLFCWTNHYLH